jgi:hypothetical protein
MTKLSKKKKRPPTLLLFISLVSVVAFFAGLFIGRENSIAEMLATYGVLFVAVSSIIATIAAFIIEKKGREHATQLQKGKHQLLKERQHKERAPQLFIRPTHGHISSKYSRKPLLGISLLNLGQRPAQVLRIRIYAQQPKRILLEEKKQPVLMLPNESTLCLNIIKEDIPNDVNQQLHCLIEYKELFVNASPQKTALVFDPTSTSSFPINSQHRTERSRRDRDALQSQQLKFFSRLNDEIDLE